MDPSWAELRVSQGEMIAIPGLWFESLYDISARSSLAYFEWNRAANAKEDRNNQVMRLTQGGHCSFGKNKKEQEHSKIGDLELGDMRYDFVGMAVDWFNRWMKPQVQPVNDMPSNYTAFVGYGQWLQADKLPMQGKEEWYLTASGGLENSMMEAEANFDYRYDPANPVVSLGGEIAGTGDDQFDGSFDQRKNQSREDVLVFTSKPFVEEVTLFGMTEIGLSVSSDKPDTDFTVKILDVYPDGRAFNIGDTILRMRYREGLENPAFMDDGVTSAPIPTYSPVRSRENFSVSRLGTKVVYGSLSSSIMPLIAPSWSLSVSVSSTYSPSINVRTSTIGSKNPYSSLVVLIALVATAMVEPMTATPRIPIRGNEFLFAMTDLHINRSVRCAEQRGRDWFVL